MAPLFYQMKITHRSIQHVSFLVCCVSFYDVAHTKLDDSALAALATTLHKLRELDLRGCGISDRGLAHCTCNTIAEERREEMSAE